ncbi:hypothetical protein [Thermophilibacter sp.]
MIDQLSVCLPNRPGRLAGVCRLLGEWGVQIHAVTIAENVDFSIVRLICDRPRSTAERLVSRGYDAMTTPLVAVEVADVPGALGSLLDRLASCDLNVDYAYACFLAGRTVDVIHVSGEPLAVKLAETGLELLDGADLYEPDEA